MSLDEFPKGADDDAVVRLATAIVAQGTARSVSARQHALFEKYAVDAGFACTTQRAMENVGAFISDVLLAGGTSSADELNLAFRPWVSPTADVGAVLAEYGGMSSAWLNSCLTRLAALLAGTDPCANAPAKHPDVLCFGEPASTSSLSES
jgi:hypothetical protein